jgi:O-antigen/teichoic acid export membrane protein
MPSLLQLFHSLRANHGRVGRALARESKRSFWALADQGIVSLGNFGVVVLLGKAFASRMDQAGDFYTLFDLMIFLNGLQGAFIVYPLTVRCAAADDQTLGRTTSLSLLMTLLGWPIMAGAMLATALAWKIPLSIGFWSAVAILFWQIQETTRRALMAHLRFREAMFGDLFSYLGQIGAMIVLWKLEKLTLVTLFQAMAITSGAAALLQAGQVRPRLIRWLDIRQFSAECWRLGRWMLVGNLTNFALGPLFTWNMRFWVGDQMLGIYNQVNNVLRFANPLMASIASVITPQAAKAYQSEDLDEARRGTLRIAALGGMILAPYLLLVFVFPETALRLMYQSNATEYLPWARILQIAVFATGVTYLCTMTGVFLTAVERTKQATVGQIIFCLAFLLIAMPLVAQWGLYGGVSGWLIAAIFQLLVNTYYVVRIDRPALASAVAAS